METNTRKVANLIVRSNILRIDCAYGGFMLVKVLDEADAYVQVIKSNTYWDVGDEFQLNLRALAENNNIHLATKTEIVLYGDKHGN